MQHSQLRNFDPKKWLTTNAGGAFENFLIFYSENSVDACQKAIARCPNN